MRQAARALAVFALALQLIVGAAHAAEPPPAAADPELEAKLQRIAQELRCLVCQNQTIADSNAELAQDLRREARRLLASGASEQEVREFMVARYGDFVLYRPPVKATTVALWVGPFLLLAVALWVARRVLVTRRRAVQGAALSDDEQERLRALVSIREPDAK
jgi:cytochrome c-type biogenesis protein CcmH